jgi:hypothetical protein
MTYFAQKLRYGAHDGEAGAHYIALLALAKKKGGRPIGFILYRRIMHYTAFSGKSRTDMIRLSAETAQEAISRFWPSDAEGRGKEFPGYHSERWEKTTLWLDPVAAGGWYESFGYRHDGAGIRPSRWARVAAPAPWSKRRGKKKPLQFGLPAHIILVDRARIRSIEEDIEQLKWQLHALESCDEDSDWEFIPDYNKAEYERIEDQITSHENEIESIEAKIRALLEGMRLEVRLKFPNPLGMTPKRASRPKESRRAPW